MSKFARVKHHASQATAVIGFALMFSLTPPVPGVGGDAQVHWDYSAERGPAVWANLSPLYRRCGQGAHQSPIDFPELPATLLSEHGYSYQPTEATVANNGHTIVVNVSEGNALTLGDLAYRLIQFHFHTPSEHKVNGKQYPMELHLVHASPDGNIAVIGIMIEPGEAHPVIDDLPVPETMGKPQPLPAPIDLDRLIPANKAHFAYTGSLTTPPCTEGVHWFVGVNPIQVSAETIEQFGKAMGENNRPVHPLNARAVVRVN